jgi:hypothetical protein
MGDLSTKKQLAAEGLRRDGTIRRQRCEQLCALIPGLRLGASLELSRDAPRSWLKASASRDAVRESANTCDLARGRATCDN